MRVIETLLGIVDMKRADGLALALGEVPALLLSGGRQPLTMPALSLNMMGHVLGDLLSTEQREALHELGKVEVADHSSAHGTYEVHARASNDKLTITLTRLAPGAAPEVRMSPVASSAPPNAPLARFAPLGDPARVRAVGDPTRGFAPLSAERPAVAPTKQARACDEPRSVSGFHDRALHPLGLRS
jgi:hypothetical protein